MIASDSLHEFRPSLLHNNLDAWPLMMIGLSYITLQLSSTNAPGEKIKGAFLGAAFLLWGGEQLLPSSRLVTVMDEGAVTIFVIDVSLIIWSHLQPGETSHLP